MELVLNNPYRIIGILSNATAKEVQSRKGKITAYAKVGKQVSSDFDFPIFNPLERENDIIEKAFSAIQQSREMLENSLFWFSNTNSFDETAINYLRNGDKEKAIEIWEKVTTEKEVTPKNYSCFNNIGTLKLLGESKEEIKEGIGKKIKLIESDSFKNFVHSVAGEAYVINNQKQLENFIDALLNQFDGKYSNADILKLFSNCNEIIQKYLTQKFTEKPLHSIENLIESTKKNRNQDRINAFQFGLKLNKNAKSHLGILKSLLGVNDLKYKMIADNLAKEIMQCGIDYFNESQKNNSSEEYLENAMQLNKLAKAIAIGKLTKDRADDQIKSLEEMKDKELLEAISVLQSIKDLYEENERKIRLEIEQMKASDIDIILGRKTINQKAVDDNLRNSIVWQKVNEMLANLLSDGNLKKIKECGNNEQKSEFIELANWLKLKSLKNQTITAIIDKYKKIPPKLPFKIISSDITNTDSKPLYTKFIRYVGLNLQVQVTEEKSVTLYLKYFNPDGSIRRNSETSPVGYSRAETQKLNLHTKSINISGWGNADKCIYNVGNNRIEVYVDEYLIYSKDFIVDLAPSEKLDKELITAESKLKEIKNTQFFKSEISNAQNQMSKILEWQFLRSQSDREMQINEKQKQIDSLIKKADNEKVSKLSKQQSIITEIKSKIQKAEY